MAFILANAEAAPSVREIPSYSDAGIVILLITRSPFPAMGWASTVWAPVREATDPRMLVRMSSMARGMISPSRVRLEINPLE
jgi:hypothetical protein